MWIMVELSEKESDERCLLIGGEQGICLRSGEPVIGFINRLGHPQMKPYDRYRTVPGRCEPGFPCSQENECHFIYNFSQHLS